MHEHACRSGPMGPPTPFRIGPPLALPPCRQVLCQGYEIGVPEQKMVWTQWTTRRMKQLKDVLPKARRRTTCRVHLEFGHATCMCLNMAMVGAAVVCPPLGHAWDELIPTRRPHACESWFAAKYTLKLCAAEWRRAGRVCPRSGHESGKSVKQILQSSYADLSTRKKRALKKKLQQFKMLQRKAATTEKRTFMAYSKAQGRNNQLKSLILQIQADAGEVEEEE